MTLSSARRGLLLVLALVLGLQAVAYAQTGAASITGLVTDQSGAAAPGVTVTATNQATNVDYTAVSNEAGNYTITSVPVGTYVVKAALTGFKTTTTRPITLEAKQIARLDFKMEVGALEDTVEVTAQAPVLQTESATVGEVISAQDGAVAAAQRPQRQPAGAAAARRGHAEPGRVHRRAQPGGGGRPVRQRQPRADEQLPARRRRHERDGRQPRSPTSRARTRSPRSAWRRTTTRPTSATSPARVISNVIKSGANQFRGNVFEFYRNSDFDANTWANNRSGAAKAERKQHIFGATLGGPIIKNKLFFFADYQGTVLDAAGLARRASVAPAAWRTRRPLEHHSRARSRDPLTGAVPDNQIPLEPDQPDRARDPEQPGLPAAEPRRHRASPATTSATPSARPAPTRATCGSTGTRRPTTSSSSASRSRSYDDKTDEDRLPAAPRRADRAPFRNLAVNWSHVFSPSLINEVLVGYNSINNSPRSTTGAASATPTRPTGSPAASRSRA